MSLIYYCKEKDVSHMIKVSRSENLLCARNAISIIRVEFLAVCEVQLVNMVAFRRLQGHNRVNCDRHILLIVNKNVGEFLQIKCIGCLYQH